MSLPKFIKFIFLGLVPAFVFGADEINITYPDVSALYSSDYNGMQVNWNYQSQSNDMQSLSWAYKLDEDFYSTSTSATQVDGNDSVDGSSWLSGLTADGGSHTLYVALLDQGSNVLAEDHHTFTYSTGSKYKSQSTLMVDQSNSNTGIPGASSGTWYQSFKADFDSKLHKFAFVTNGVFDANATVTIREGVGTNGNILHTGTWTGIGTITNNYNEYTPDEDVVLTLDHNYTIQLQDQTSGGFIGHSSNQYDDGMFYYSGYSGEYGDLKMKIWTFEEKPNPDSISIHYPNVSVLYSSGYNGMQVQWNYQSQSNDMQSLSWAYKLDEDFYGTSTSATQVDGNDSVDGSSWLSGLTADGGSHTLYVALLDQGSNVLATDSHGFTYQSGSSGTQSPGSGTQSPDSGYQTPTSGYQSPDGISIHYPDVSILYSSDYNGMQVDWNYQSQSNDIQSLSWAYKLDEDFYGTGTSATQVDGNDSVDGSSWLSGLTADGGSHTLYVALLDQGSNVLATDSHGFTYQSGSSGTQSPGSGTQSPGGGYQSGGSGYQSPDGISIHYPNVSVLYSSGYNGMQVQWNYQSQSNDMQSLSWAYKLDEDFYGTSTSATQVDGNDSVDGSSWLSGLTADGGSHTLYVALLDQGSNVLATDSHGFTYQSGSSGTQSPGSGTQSPSGGYQTPTSGYQTPDGISIHYPDVSILYSSDYNGMQVNWNYQSQSNDMQSLSWAYKLDEDFYGTSTSATQVDGNDSVDGSSWLSGLTADGGSHTLYVALLDPGSNVLATDSHSFNYNAGSDPYSSGGSGTQSGDGGTQSPDGGYQSGGSGYQSPDGISIHYPDVSILYSSGYNGMQVNWNYQSQSNDMQSLSWAYKLDEDFYGTSTSATQVDGNDSVDGSSWLSGLTADGGSHTLYVALLDQESNVLATDSHGFTYQSGSSGTQSPGSGTQSPGGGDQSGGSGYQSPDGISIRYPNVSVLYSSDYNGMQVNWNYQSQSNDMQSLSWAYKLDEDFYSTSISATQLDGNDSVDGSSWLSGLTADGGSHTLYVALLDQESNVLATDSHGFTYQSGGSGTQSGDTGYQSGDSGYQSDDGTYQSGDGTYQSGDGTYQSGTGSYEYDEINISYPNVYYLYSSGGNGLTIDWNYQSQDNGIQSLSWAYKLNEDFYGTSTSATQVSGTDSVDGSTWLSGVSTGVEHTLYVALLDQVSGDVLDTDEHHFWYSAGSDPYSSGDTGYQSGDSGYQSPGDGYQSDSTGFNTINITYPTIYNVSDWNSLEIEWTYASGVADQSSPRFGYTIDENISTQGVYINEFNTFNVYGSEWLSGLSDGEHTVYVALLDPSDGSILATDSHLFSLTSSTDQGSDPSDSITIMNPTEDSVIQGDATLSVELSYASASAETSSPRWAYKIDEDFYSTQTSATEVNSYWADGWLDGLENGQHTVYVALLDPWGGDYIFAEDNVSFELTGGDDFEKIPFFFFNDTALSYITQRTDLLDGNYTIFMDHNGSQSSNFKIAPVFEDENGYILVDMDRSVNATIDFASLETYLDANQITEEGFVDFLPFNFQPIDRIDLNNSSELQSLLNGYDNIFYQEFTPRSWQGYDDFNGTNLDTSKWNYAYFAGGVSASISNGKGVLSGSSSTGSDSAYLPDFMEMNVSDLPNDQGNSALFIHDQDVFGVELDITIPSSTNTQEVGFFIDIIDTTSDVDHNHHEIIELSWRSNGLNWNWDYKDEQNQTVYKQKDAELDQTYRLSVIQNGIYTFISIDGNRSAVFRNEFTPKTWMIGAFNDAGQEFEAEIDNVRVLKSSMSNSQTYWAISIEQGHNYDANISDLVVDMAGYVYEGHFSDYWYNWFGVVTSDPDAEFEELSGNTNWFEIHYPIPAINDIYSNHSVLSEDQLYLNQTIFEILENNDLNSSVGQLSVSLPELLGEINFGLDDYLQQLPFSVDTNGTIKALESFDYETDSSFYATITVIDEFDRNFSQSIYLSLQNQVEDFDNDGIEDHLDTDQDGDGFSDEEEVIAGTDPRDANSLPNRAPHSLRLSNAEVFENETVGTLVGEFSATDPDGDVLTYRIVLNDYSSSHNDPQYDSGLDQFYGESSYDPNNYGYTDYSHLEPYGYDELGPDGMIGTGDEYMFLDPITGEIIYSEPFGDVNLGSDGLPVTGEEYIIGDPLYDPNDPNYYDPYYGYIDPITDPHYGDSLIDPYLGDYTGSESLKDDIESESISTELPFKLSESGLLTTTRELDYETDPTSYLIHVMVMDSHGFEYVDVFTINLLNVVEDLDGDGIEDHYDLDDDNDGFSDEEEYAYPSDPRDPNSVANVAPDSLSLSNAEVLENQPDGSIVGIFEGTDPDGGQLTYILNTYEHFTTENEDELPEEETSYLDLPFYVEQNGTLLLSRELDYEVDDHTYTLFVEVSDEHGFVYSKEFIIHLLNVVEDLDGDGEEDHYDLDDDNDGFNDDKEIELGFDHRNLYSRPELALVQTLTPNRSSDGKYILRGKLLADGGVQLSDLGFEVTGDGFAYNQTLNVDSNVTEGSEFTLSLDFLNPGGTYTFRAFATNLVGHNSGALRKFTVENSQDWWFGAEELETGWKSNWFGVFLPQPNGWAYHADLGWAFISPDSDGGIWFWVEDNGWHWTRDGIWPFMWSNNTSDWMYLMKSGTRTFIYDYSTESFITDF